MRMRPSGWSVIAGDPADSLPTKAIPSLPNPASTSPSAAATTPDPQARPMTHRAALRIIFDRSLAGTHERTPDEHPRRMAPGCPFVDASNPDSKAESAIAPRSERG